MTEVNETTPRRRGRPKKTVENHQSDVVDNRSVDQITEENESMENQIRFQMKALLQMAKNLGVELDDLYERPPVDDTLVIDPNPSTPHRSGRPRPGSLLGDPKDPNVAFVPWRKEDLDPSDTVTFVPQPIPSLVFPLTDDEGHQKIRLDVNDLVCWLTVGVQSTVNRFFYNAYMDAYNSWRDLENFKRRGPAHAPWGRTGPDGRPSWLYDPAPVSFGMDIDGRFLTSSRNNPITETQAANPDAI